MSDIHRKGFTIVELIIVVSVIAILATVASVAYTSVRLTARDTQRQSNVDTIADALKVYFGKNKPDTNCGNTANSSYGDAGLPGYGHYMSGFLSLDYDGAGPRKSVEQCLKDAGLINDPVLDPSKTISCTPGLRICYSYMVATCVTEGQYVTYVYANREAGDHTSTNLTDNTCQIADTYDTQYGMNYHKQAQ